MSAILSSRSVRAAARSDAAAINRIYNHYIRNTTITFDVEAWSTQRRQTWLDEFPARGPYYVLVSECNGEITGFACNHPFRPRAAYQCSTETTIYTDPENPAPGTGNALYQALFTRLLKTDLHRAYAVIALPNPRSITFHQRFGFTPVGTLHQVGRKFGRYVDVTWFEKPLP